MEQSSPESPLSPYEDDVKAVKYLSKSRHTIYLAMSQSTKKYYALKAYFYEKGEISSSFHQETKVKPLIHENIISILDSKKRKKDQHGKLFSYNLLEFAPYGNLAELFADTKVYEDEILTRTIFHQIVNGVEFLHKNGISHMDLKLSNLLLGNDFKIKIVDFEFSQFDKSEPILGRGTSGYRAPELKKGESEDTKKTDIYSLGIILFVLNTGNHPYIENTVIGTYDLEEMVLRQDETFWSIQSKVSATNPIRDDDFKKLFWSLVKKNPEKRLSIEELKKSAWYNKQVYNEEEYKSKLSNYFQLSE